MKIDLFDKYGEALDDMFFLGCGPQDIAVFNLLEGNELTKRDKAELDKIRKLSVNEVADKIKSCRAKIAKSLMETFKDGSTD